MSEEQSVNAEALATIHDQEEADKKKKTYEILTDKVVRALEKGTAPWMRNWAPGELELPFNHQSGKFYHGPNAIRLLIDGRSDPRWMTRKQIDESGLRVRPEEMHKGVVCFYYGWVDYRPKLDADGNEVRDERGRVVKEQVRLSQPKVGYFVVWNGEQIEGMPPFVPQHVTQAELAESFRRVNSIVSGTGVRISPKLMGKGESAHYDPRGNKIVIPPVQQYMDGREHFCDLLRGAASAVDTRVHRQVKRGREDDPVPFARVMRVEMASLLMARTLNIGFTATPRDAAYEAEKDRLIQALRDDPRLILGISQDAENLQKYTLAYEYVHTLAVSLEEAAEKVIPGERAYVPAPRVRDSVRREQTPVGVVHANAPLPTQVEQHQVEQAKEVRTQEERAITAQIKAARVLERKQAVESYRSSVEIDPKEGCPPCARRSLDGEQTIYPMAGADGRLAAVMIRSKGTQVAKLPEGVRNQHVFCAFGGMKPLIGDSKTLPPRNVKPVVIVGNSASGHVLWHAGANVVMAVSPAAMGKAAEALRAVRPDAPIVFALERGDRAREPKVPTMSDGRPFENATAIRPPSGEATFTAGEANTKKALKERYAVTLQTAQGALRRSDAAAKLQDLNELERTRENELALELQRSNQRSRGRSR